MVSLISAILLQTNPLRSVFAEQEQWLPKKRFFFWLIVALVIGSCHPPALYKNCHDLLILDDMVCISGGFFLRGSERESIDEDSRHLVRDESPVQTIELSTFLIDRYEVTYGDYQKCVKAGGCTAAKPNYRGYSDERQPMLGVNWYQARDYCRWRGKRLPTEAEWEKAARGPDGELYPWGNEPANCDRAVIDEKSTPENILGAGSHKGCGTGVTAPVGSRPAGRYGLYDMAGNSWEWVDDWYSPSYGECGRDCQGKDPRGPCADLDRCTTTKYKIVRGGSWWWPAESALGSNRRPHFADNQPFHHFGFRCARGID